MNEKALRTLEYYKIIEKLEAYASSAQAKDMCRMLKPSANIDVIVKMQQETADALSRVLASGRLSFSGLTDVRASIKRLEVGGALTISELLAISKVLDVALRAK
ncbi:MAG: endonuclease MutS2, partial [Lachnospiraceae bacterium]|nr:endonuclease MutS2 [Lachnospiraceae bacterium]